jgi:hypothetical protein
MQWCIPENYEAVTKGSYSTKLCWPLTSIVLGRRRDDVSKRLALVHADVGSGQVSDASAGDARLTRN